ncbi:hypothetical protein H4696_000981 [Amycolatopsis lexingtonensis]|uniref:DUF1963 domain-containing protein n=1 Tax=Amycolatopsis lexingtonensis TaxID=218822 RepID=A0ABR9HSH8_9PSEU|nr:DUF1963 domain-containing protein [Amycolatopsis lexingtonensis]MBE1493881.1 hypothetical protein [Amycolatopsis lexingtonensis]
MNHLEQLRSTAIERGVPAEAADRIGRFLRVAIWVCAPNRYGAGSAEQHGGVVGQNGGLPRLPVGTEWPYADISGLGRLPLPFIASLDCAKLPRADGLELPADGSLLFFLAHEHALHSDDEHEFARVVHVPAGTATAQVDQPPPHDDDWFESGFLRLRSDLVALVQPEMPGWFDEPENLEFESDAVQLQVGDTAHLEDLRTLFEELWPQATTGADLYLGGYSMELGIGENAEYGMAEDSIAHDVPDRDRLVEEETIRLMSEWLPLAQFQLEDQVHVGRFLIRHEDLAARRFDRVRSLTMFTE